MTITAEPDELHAPAGLDEPAWPGAAIVRWAVFLLSIANALSFVALRRRGVGNTNACIRRLWPGGVFGIGYTGADTLALAFICIAGMNILSAASMGAGLASVNEMTPNRMRAQVGALSPFAINLVGTGLGPTIVALLGDGYFSGANSLGKAIRLTSALFGLPAIGFLWPLVRHYPAAIPDGITPTHSTARGVA